MDLREHLDRLDKAGWLVKIDREVDWRLEAACIDAMNARLDGPRLLFNNIKGYSGKRLVNNYLEGTKERFWRGYAFALGLETDIEWEPFVQELYRRVDTPIKPVQVSTGPCKENIRMGKEVNLLEFPWPYLHEGDGGRYGTIMTWIVKDPDSSWVNWGNYRMQIHTKNKVGTLWSEPGHMWTLYHNKYEARGIPMPTCVAFGAEPTVTLGTIFRAYKGENEVDIAGGLNLEPIQLVKAETNDLLVPANAELILEGEIRPYERLDEGPFGEMIGFMHGPRVPGPVARINCITYRSSPILPFLTEGMESGSGNSLSRLATNLGMHRRLKTTHLPLTYDTQLLTNWSLRIGTLWEKYPGCSDEVMFQIAPGLSYRCLVDPEDWQPPSDLAGAIEACFLKAHPTQWKITDSDMRTTDVNLLSPQDKKRGMRSACGIDGTWPPAWSQVPERVRFENSYPSHIQEWAARNWERLGLPGKAGIKKPRMRHY